MVIYKFNVFEFNIFELDIFEFDIFEFDIFEFDIFEFDIQLLHEHHDLKHDHRVVDHLDEYDDGPELSSV